MGGVILLFFIVPKKVQWIVLLAASLGFYLTWGWEALPFLAGSTFIAWICARLISGKYKEIKDPAPAKKQARPFLLLALTGLLGVLLYSKIGNVIARSDPTVRIISILGVSYFTFSLIAYVADVYWRKIKAEPNYFRLLLFVSYFPKVLQGPISRQNFLGPQLREEHKFNYSDFCNGLQLMVWGYFKKLVIADRLALMTNRVFGNIEGESGSHLLVAAMFAAVQLYCDFSGCMDIAGGLSEVLGLKLEQNFDHPFFSNSAAEFWRRWHITLGNWFRDYVYMPLVISPRLIGLSKKVRERFGKRAGKAVMTVVPSLAVWILTGLWHSTGWNYVVWGLYWFTLITGSTIFAPEIKKFTKLLRINTETEGWSLFQTVRTFFLFVIGRILTVPGDLGLSMKVFGKIFGDFRIRNLVDESLYTLGMDRPDFILACVCMLILLVVSRMQLKGSVRERIARQNIVLRWAIYYLAFFAVLIFGIYGPGYDAGSFVYMQF